MFLKRMLQGRGNDRVESRKRRTTHTTITMTGEGRKLGTDGGGRADMSLLASAAAMVFHLALTNTHKDVKQWF